MPLLAAPPGTGSCGAARLRRTARRLTGLLLLSALGMGCGAVVPIPRPADYPLHTVASPIAIHWQLTVAPDRVRAEGLAERLNPSLGRVRLQLLGLDATGKIVSFTTPTTVWWRAWDTEPFSTSLVPRGGEQRYEMRVFSFDYREEEMGL